jgi:hypothetical protein
MNQSKTDLGIVNESQLLRFGISPLTNIVFWAGAGFSKAWEPSSPVGSQLFTINRDSLG